MRKKSCFDQCPARLSVKTEEALTHMMTVKMTTKMSWAG